MQQCTSAARSVQCRACAACTDRCGPHRLCRVSAEPVSQHTAANRLPCTAWLYCDLVSNFMQVASDLAVEQLTAVQSAAEWRNTDALHSSLKSCR